MKITKRSNTQRITASISRAPKQANITAATASLNLTVGSALTIGALKKNLRALHKAHPSARLSRAIAALRPVNSSNTDQYPFEVLTAYKALDDMLFHNDKGICKSGNEFNVVSGTQKQAFYTRKINNAMKRYSVLNS